MFPFMFTKEVKDAYAQENFLLMADYFKSDPFVQGGFKFFEVTHAAAISNHLFVHNLGFHPKDLILMHNLTNVSVTFDYANFDANHIKYTLSGPTTLRFLLGRCQ